MSVESARTSEGYRLAEGITRDRAKSFAFASRVLDQETRRASFAVYAFCRRCDDTVDAASGTGDDLRERVAGLRRQLEAAYQGDDLQDPVLAAFSDTVRSRQVPKDAFEELIDGMEQDLTVHRYETWEETLHYCELAAGTVGRMMAAVFGVRDASALVPAAALGRAMQLTNILRDVREDFVDHGRVYLPWEGLKPRGLTESHLNEFARQGFLSRSGPGDAFRDLVQETAFRARCLYAEADKGIPELVTPMGRSCVRLMRAIYSEILAELEKQGWDPFLGRARTTLGRKLQVGAKAVILPEWS